MRACMGLHNGQRDGMLVYDNVEMIEGQNVRMGDGINCGAGLDKEEGMGVWTGDNPELAEGSGVGTSDGSGLGEGPANCAGLHDGPSDGMFA